VHISRKEHTLADIVHLIYGYALKALYQIDLLEDESKRPNVVRWWREITARPAWIEARDEWVVYRNATMGSAVSSKETK
jgi:glutathione S-transferase